MNKEMLNIALVGNAPREKHEMLNAMLAEEDLTDLCRISLYGADGEPEKEAMAFAINDYDDGNIDGIACLPMAEQPVNDAVNVKIAENVRLAAVKATDEESIKEFVKQLHKAMRRDLGIQNPRIAVYCPEENIPTKESETEGETEENYITSVISELMNGSIQAFGPLTEKQLLADDSYKAYDVIATVTFKDNALWKMENLLKRISTSGAVTLYANAEKPVTTAQPDDILHAIYTVIDVIRNRKAFDEPYANPLEKLYHERKENGDKSRFAVKKKGFNPAEHRRENVTYVTQ